MRLTLALLGLELDVTFGVPAADVVEDDGPAVRGVDGTYVGFVPRHEIPDEAAIERPTSPWEDDSEAGR